MAKIVKALFLLLILVAVGCSHGRTMTMTRYHEIDIGHTVTMVHKKAGNPYEVKETSEGETEYLYIERIEIGTDIYQQREYSITFRDGLVTHKQFQDRRSQWDFIMPPN